MNLLLIVTYDPWWNEYTVEYWDNGTYDESKSYYTNDLDDALGTALAMKTEQKDNYVNTMIEVKI